MFPPQCDDFTLRLLCTETVFGVHCFAEECYWHTERSDNGVLCKLWSAASQTVQPVLLSKACHVWIQLRVMVDKLVLGKHSDSFTRKKVEILPKDEKDSEGNFKKTFDKDLRRFKRKMWEDPRKAFQKKKTQED